MLEIIIAFVKAVGIVLMLSCPVLRELDTYNNERRKRGECPISYGKYVAIRGGFI